MPVIEVGFKEQKWNTGGGVVRFKKGKNEKSKK